MATLASILTDPNYVNANPATKQAIFDKYAAQNANFSNANPATQEAIRVKFGVSQARPSSAANQIPGYGRPVPAAQTQQDAIPTRRQAVAQFIAPTVEALGTVGGAALGSAAGPAGTVTGAGVGFAGAKELMRIAGGGTAPETLSQAAARQTQAALEGATMEAAGRGVIAPIIGKGMEYASKLTNIKLDTYLKAIGNKGDDIVNALRGRPSAVPGAAPTAGEVAAPAGSTGFSTLQARALEVPAMTDIYADMAAQTNQARLAQQTRADAKFRASADKVKQKIDTGLTNVSQREAGQTLLDAARAEQQRAKATITEPAYRRAFAAAGDAKINVGNVIDEAESILGRKLSTFDPSTAPSTVSKLLSLQPAAPAAKPVGVGLISSRIKTPTPPAAAPEVTLAQLDDVRKAINADIASAARSSDPSAAVTLRNLGKLHRAIDAAVDGSPTLSAEAKTLYKQALDTYRTQYAPRFKTGVNANLFKQTALNEPRLNPDDVIKTYFQPRGEREAQQFVAMFGKNADATRIARSGIEDLYRREVTDAAGRVTPEAHAKFLKKYADPIRILDEAGMSLTPRLDAVAKDAARLAKIDSLAMTSQNKLAPALAPGSNALAIEKRISELTKGLTPQQLSHVNAVRNDLVREGDYQRLVDAGAKADIRVRGLGTETGKELGLPLPSFLNNTITLFNNVFKKLALRMDDKIAMEIARELTSPAKAADMVETAMALRRGREMNQMPEFYGRAAAQFGNELSRRAEPMSRVNALAP
jgi:hypothetical protein